MAYLRLVTMPFLIQIQFTPVIFLWLLGCLALGVGYAFILYRSAANLTPALQKILFAFRTITVALLAFLLFAPLFKTTHTTIEKPLIVLAQDNSASIGIAPSPGFDPAAYSRQYKDLATQLSKDYEIRTFSFGNVVTDGLTFRYNAQLTDISSLFREIGNRFSNRNIGAIILASDGIYNRGGNPQYEIQNLKAPVYTVALGDTIPKKDLIVSNVNYNNIAYLDNQFQIEVSIEAFLCKGVNTLISISDKSGRILSKPVNIKSDEYRQSVPFVLTAKARGIHRYTITASTTAGELSKENNTQTIYVEVIDGRKKVLIVANAPHPDIAALKQSIESNKNYAVKVMLAADARAVDLSNSDLFVLHQLPSLTNNAQNILSQLHTKPVFYILGAQTNIQNFSGSQQALGITSSGATQEAVAQVRSDFYAFTLSDDTKRKLTNFAPLLTPFGNYGLKGNTSVLLNQQVGKVATTIPLMLFAEEGQRRTAILAGEGLWRWRLEEFQESGTHDAVNELMSKSLQYLSAADDKRKFRAYPSKSSFDENERIILNAELYNDAYELVNTPDVRISLKNTTGKNYSYNFSKTGNAYVLDAGVLPAGEYRFNAATQLGTAKHAATGQFIISGQSAELRQTTANHQLLYSLAEQSGGKMVAHDQMDELPMLIKANETIKTISYENRNYEELIDLKLIFFVALALLSVEWFLRKRNGEI